MFLVMLDLSLQLLWFDGSYFVISKLKVWKLMNFQ
jgi:hypothetical protein